MDSLSKIKRRLKGLKQNQGLSEEELNRLAKEKLEREEILSSLVFIVDEKEKKLAEDLLSRYLTNSSIESEADKDTLKQLIDLEILVERIKEFLKKESIDKKGAIPTHMLQELRDTNDQVLVLKEKLGLSSENKENANWVEVWENLKKKAIKYYEEHKGCNTVKCPYCQGLFHLLFDRTKYKEIKSTWFRGTILYNDKLYSLYHEKKITKEEMVNIFGVSEFYIDLLYNSIYLKNRKE